MFLKEFRFKRKLRKVRAKFSDHLKQVGYDVYVKEMTRLKGDYKILFLLQTPTEAEKNRIENDSDIENALEGIFFNNFGVKFQKSKNMYWVLSQEHVYQHFGGDWHKAVQ